ncbi:MAG TPA: SMI1/KNR4 family protein [Spirillospora sp.]
MESGNSQGDRKVTRRAERKQEPEGNRITFPDPAEDWRPFLKQWSEQYIAWRNSDYDPAPSPEAVRQGWLGSAPAEPAEISALEERLGLTLPRSLRTFLQTTNGWPDTGFLPAIGKTSEIGFMRDVADGWIRMARDSEEQGGSFWPGTAVLERSVQISTPASDPLFLDPEDVNENGEWAAYFIRDFFIDESHETLFDLIADVYVGFYDLRRPRR